MIKLKDLLTEDLKDMEPKNLPKGEHGFDLTEFKPGGFERILLALGATRSGTKMNNMWRWTGMRPYAGKRVGRVTLWTKNNPITGQPSGEKNYASYMGVEGHKSGVEQLVKFIRKEAEYIKGESPGRRDYI